MHCPVKHSRKHRVKGPVNKAKCMSVVTMRRIRLRKLDFAMSDDYNALYSEDRFKEKLTSSVNSSKNHTAFIICE